jgi:hypothetical protein
MDCKLVLNGPVHGLSGGGKVAEARPVGVGA